MSWQRGWGEDPWASYTAWDAGWGQWSERPSTTTSWSWDERPTSWSWDEGPGGCGPARAEDWPKSWSGSATYLAGAGGKALSLPRQGELLHELLNQMVSLAFLHQWKPVTNTAVFFLLCRHLATRSLGAVARHPRPDDVTQRVGDRERPSSSDNVILDSGTCAEVLGNLRAARDEIHAEPGSLEELVQFVRAHSREQARVRGVYGELRRGRNLPSSHQGRAAAPEPSAAE